MYYPCSENKDADQLRGYREADLRLCFRPCKLLVFSRTGSFSVRSAHRIGNHCFSLPVHEEVSVSRCNNQHCGRGIESTTRKTCPCNIYLLIPQFYIAKLGYAGVYLFFLIFAPKHRLWVLVRTASARRF